jgi:hypothetical protein
MEAKVELLKIQQDLISIGQKKVSLDEIEIVLNRSIDALKCLQQSVSDLVMFFNKIGDTVRHAQEHQIVEFLETINEPIDASGGSTDPLLFKNIAFFKSQQEVSIT